MKVSIKARKTKTGYSIWVVHSDGMHLNGKPNREVYRAKIYLLDGDWDEKKKALKKNSPRYRELKGQFDELERRLYSIRDGLVLAGLSSSPANVRAEFEKQEKPSELAPLMAEYINKMKGVAKSTKYRYEAALFALDSFCKNARYEDLNDYFGRDFITHMTESGLSISTAGVYMSLFKKFIRENFKHRPNCLSMLDSWKRQKAGKYKKPYLLPEEREIWEAGDPGNEIEQAAKDIGIFLIEMNYRFGEAYNLKPENLIESKEHPLGLFHYVKNKEKKGDVRLWRKPITRKASVIWHKYKGVLPFHFFVKTNLQTHFFNINVRRYAKRIGLNRKCFDKHGEQKELHELISSHSFRHTFARIKWREEGHDAMRIGLAMGHDDPNSIKSYLDPEDRDGYGVFDEK